MRTRYWTLWIMRLAALLFTVNALTRLADGRLAGAAVEALAALGLFTSALLLRGADR